MSEPEDPLSRLFAQTATVERDPTFVARVVTEARRHRRPPIAVSGLAIDILKALGLAIVAGGAATAIGALSDPLTAVVTIPAVSYGLLALAGSVTLALFLRPRAFALKLRYPRSLAPVAFSAAATMRPASASISTSVRVASRGWMVTSTATDLAPSGTPLPS
jgi:hypothetical protein